MANSLEKMYLIMNVRSSIGELQNDVEAVDAMCTILNEIEYHNDDRIVKLLEKYSAVVGNENTAIFEEFERTRGELTAVLTNAIEKVFDVNYRLSKMERRIEEIFEETLKNN